MSTKTITKSVRLTPEESAALAQLSEQTMATESALLKRWVQQGMRAQKLDLAIHAYMDRRVDVRGAAAMAEVSYNRFAHELQARRIVILEEERFLERTLFLAKAFSDEALQLAAEKVLGLAT